MKHSIPAPLTKVTHVTYWGYETTLWEGADPTPVTAGRGVSRVPVSPGFKTGRIKLYFDSPTVPGWNEIDAVGIEDANKKVIWAPAQSQQRVGQRLAAVSQHANGYMAVTYSTDPASAG